MRHRLNRGGNRRLNWAIQLIALTQARCDPRARAYLARRRAEGRTGREAIRSLKRHLSDVIYRQLVADARAAALTWELIRVPVALSVDLSRPMSASGTPWRSGLHSRLVRSVSGLRGRWSETAPIQPLPPIIAPASRMLRAHSAWGASPRSVRPRNRSLGRRFHT